MRNGDCFEILLDDLKEEVQKELIEFLGDNGNYDVIPMVVLTRGDEE